MRRSADFFVVFPVRLLVLFGAVVDLTAFRAAMLAFLRTARNTAVQVQYKDWILATTFSIIIVDWGFAAASAASNFSNSLCWNLSLTISRSCSATLRSYSAFIRLRSAFTSSISALRRSHSASKASIAAWYPC